MGNLCSKSDSENFAQPGRVLGSAPEQPQRASVPANVGRTVGGPPRTLGSAGGATGNYGTVSTPATSGAEDDARRRAAEAAEVRLFPSCEGGRSMNCSRV